MLTKFVYIEERAAALRLVLAVPEWFGIAHTPLLERWARPLVTVRRCTIREAKWRPAREGKHRVLVPGDVNQWQRQRFTLHEMAHPLLDVGFSEIAQTMTDAERQRNPEAARADQYEETLADEFILALRMPMALVAAIDDVDRIQKLTGIPRSFVSRRVERVNGEVLKLTTLPRWCAARKYRLELHQDALLLLDGERPRLVVPVDRETRQERELRLKGDLFAMRPHELLTKYARYAAPEDSPVARCRRPIVLPVELAELREWSAQRASRRTYDGAPLTH